MFKGKSPAQQFTSLVKIWFVLLVVTFGGCSLGFKLDAPYTEKVSHNATMVYAYSTMQKCGKHNSCEEFIGRFNADDGKQYDREIDGFFYHRWVDEGKKDMPSYLTLNKNQQGIETPSYIKLLMFMGVVFGFVFIAGGMTLLIGGIEVEYEQDKWEREQERKRRGW